MSLGASEFEQSQDVFVFDYATKVGREPSELLVGDTLVVVYDPDVSFVLQAIVSRPNTEVSSSDLVDLGFGERLSDRTSRVQAANFVAKRVGRSSRLAELGITLTKKINRRYLLFETADDISLEPGNTDDDLNPDSEEQRRSLPDIQSTEPTGVVAEHGFAKESTDTEALNLKPAEPDAPDSIRLPLPDRSFTEEETEIPETGNGQIEHIFEQATDEVDVLLVETGDSQIQVTEGELGYENKAALLERLEKFAYRFGELSEEDWSLISLHKGELREFLYDFLATTYSESGIPGMKKRLLCSELGFEPPKLPRVKPASSETYSGRSAKPSNHKNH